MLTSIMFSIRVPKEFDLQIFESNFIKEFLGFGVNVYDLIKWNTIIVERPGDVANFQFKTDYDFNRNKVYESCFNEYIYDKLNTFKNRFNEKSKIKLQTVNLLNNNQ
jgi:hypothetical protein